MGRENALYKDYSGRASQIKWYLNIYLKQGGTGSYLQGNISGEDTAKQSAKGRAS